MHPPTADKPADARSGLMAGPPEPRICTATGLPTQVCADALDTIEKKPSSEMMVERNMDALLRKDVCRAMISDQRCPCKSRRHSTSLRTSD